MGGTLLAVGGRSHSIIDFGDAEKCDQAIKDAKKPQKADDTKNRKPSHSSILTCPDLQPWKECVLFGFRNGAPFHHTLRLAAKQITAFSIDQVTGALTPITPSVPTSDGPTSITVDSQGRLQDQLSTQPDRERICFVTSLALAGSMHVS